MTISEEVRGSLLGGAVKRVEDPRLITGRGSYVGNQSVEGELWMFPVRSTVPHGLLRSVDTAEAAAMPGVVGVFTADDVSERMGSNFTGHPEATFMPLITADRVRFVGDIVAVVVAETRREAADAAEAVWADIDPLAAIAHVEDSVAEGAELLFPDHGSNVVLENAWEADTDPLEGADVVVRYRIVHQRLAAIPLEANNALSIPVDGGVKILLGSQSPSGASNHLSKALDVDRSELHVIIPDMGGGFGAKIWTYREQALTAVLARRLQRPVRWQEDRTENMVSMVHGRAQIHDVALAARNDGTLVGADFTVLQDSGSYPLFGCFLPTFTRRMSSGPYDIPRISYRFRSAVTNTTSIHAYRGAGRPEAAATLERGMDLLAQRLGLDPAELRRRNLRDREDFPAITAVGERYDTGDYQAALELATTMAGYQQLRDEQARRRKQGDRLQLGIGVSCYVEMTAPINRKDKGGVEIHADGTATVFSGAASHGQSHETTFSQVASEVLRIPLERISFRQADTREAPVGGGTAGSRSLQMVGSAILRASDRIVEKARLIVSHAAEADPEDVVQFEDGTIGVAGVPDSGRSWGEIAALASDPANLPAGMDSGLLDIDSYEQDEATVPFGSHVSVVEVDTETGDVRVLRHIACDDPGNVINRMVVDGQVHGGVAQGIGQALFEHVRYDEDANPITGNLTTYLIPTASVLPAFEVDRTCTPTTGNPLGVKGIGEAGTVGSTPAVQSAVIDAVSHLGVTHIDMPLTPARVWEAIRRAAPTESVSV